MKTCPVCHAATFDDAATCFNCLHSFRVLESAAQPSTVAEEVLQDSWFFGPEDSTQQTNASGESADIASARAREQRTIILTSPASFMLSLAPTRAESGQIAWSCTVQPAST